MADDKPILTDEEREKLLAEDALRRNRRARYYGKLTQTSSKYEMANIVRGKTYGQIVSERMLRGDGGVSAFKGALGEKIGAVGTGIREKFDPIRLLNKVPVVGSALATMYGMKRGRSAADISYFTGAGRFLQQQREPGKLSTEDDGTGLASKVTTSVSEKIGTATKIGKDGASSSNAPKNINNAKTTLGALKKLYSLEKMWYDEEKKSREELKRDREIAQNFKEEQDMERHRELMKALTGKSSKLDTKKIKEKKEEKEDIFDFATKMGVYEIGKSMLARIGPWILEFIAGPAFLGVAAGIITALGIKALANATGKIYEKATGKSVESKAAYDKKSTSKPMQEDIIWSEVNYNEGAYKRDKEELTKKDIKPGRKKDLEERTSRYERVQEFKKTDTFQQYKKQEQSKPSKFGGKPVSFEDWKKQQGMSGDDKSLMIRGKPITRNLRNNNPGNVRFEKGGFAEKFGAIGADAAGFAIFPTMEAGEKAQKYLLFESESKDKSRSYKNLTVDQAVAKYAPSSENDTSQYQSIVKNELGSSYDPNKKLSDYSPEDKQKIVTAMQKMEGGTVQEYKLAQEKSISTSAAGTTSGDPTQHPNYKKYLAEELKKAGNSQTRQDNAYDKAKMRASADMISGVPMNTAVPDNVPQTASKVPEKPQLKIFGKTIAELTGKKKSTDTLKDKAWDDLADQEAEQLIADARDSGALSDPGTVKQYSPMAKADGLSSRMNAAVSENKNLTSNQQNIPPIVMNTTNNMGGGKGGGQSTPMGPTPIRNDEPMLLRSQYGIVKPV